MTKLAVIIPVYNSELYLARCIESVLSQTLSDIIILLVDDGSNDLSGKICDEYADKYDNVFSMHKKNGGAASARNYGLDYLFDNNFKFEYIAFLDSDDFIHPQMYESLIRLIEENGADIASCQYRFVSPDEKVSFDNVKCKVDTVITCSDLNTFDSYVSSVSVISPCMRVCKKDIFYQLRFKEGYIEEDSILLPYIWESVSKWVRTNEKMYFWTERKGSVTRSDFCANDFSRVMVCYIRADFFESRNRKEQLVKYSKQFMEKCVLYRCLAKKYGLEGSFSEYRKLYNKKWFKYLVSGKYCFNEYLMHILFRLHIPYAESIYKKLNPDWEAQR